MPSCQTLVLLVHLAVLRLAMNAMLLQRNSCFMKSCIRSSQGTRHPARITIQRDSTSSSVPWSTIDYHTKKKQRLADAYGNLIHSDATLLEPAVWTNDTKLALALRVGHRLIVAGDEEVMAMVVTRVCQRLKGIRKACPLS